MVFLAALAVYWFTLGPTVWVGDSGELIAAAHGLGIPHPTGYPLWLLATKAFTVLVPVGSVAFRANLFAAICAAAAAEVLARALRRLGAGRLASAGGGLSLALLAPIWGEATVARTYPLAALFSAGMLWCVARFLAEPRARWLFAHQGLLGLGLANHPMVIAHLPALLAIIVPSGFFKNRVADAGGREARRVVRSPKVWLAALLAVLPGLLLYLYLPARAEADPPLEYRVPMEPGGAAPWSGSGPKELVDLSFRNGPALNAYLSRDFHHSRRWAQSAGDHVTIVGHHLGVLWRELMGVGAGLAALGAVAAWRARRGRLVVAIALLWLGNLVPLALHGAWWDLFLYSRYLTTGYVGMVLLVGLGIDALVRPIATRSWRPGLVRAAPAAVALALPVLLLAVNWRACDRRDGWLAEDYARALLAELPSDAQVLSGNDSALYPLLTLQLVEQVRPDVQLVSPLQLVGDAEIMDVVRAVQRGEPPPSPASLRPAFTPDSVTPFPGLERERHGLLHRLLLPGWPREPRAPYELAKPASRRDDDPRPIRGLERDDEPDPFARSVIGAIEADLADAEAVRGRRAEARARLERVVRLRCPRPWGNVTGMFTLARLASDAQRRAQAATTEEEEERERELDRARADWRLAHDLIRVARECGNPRDPDVVLWLQEIEAQLAKLGAPPPTGHAPPK